MRAGWLDAEHGSIEDLNVNAREDAKNSEPESEVHAGQVSEPGNLLSKI